MQLLHDVHHLLTPIEEARLGKALEPYSALHVDIAINNFGLQEFMRHTPETDAVFPHGYWFEDGYLHPSEEPGLGVEIDEELAARYPYRPASLPVNRLVDGTLFHW